MSLPTGIIIMGSIKYLSINACVVFFRMNIILAVMKVLATNPGVDGSDEGEKGLQDICTR